MASVPTTLGIPVIIPVDYIPPIGAYERQVASVPFAEEIVREGQAHAQKTGDIVFGTTDVCDAMPAVQMSMVTLTGAIRARITALALENQLFPTDEDDASAKEEKARTVAILLAVERSGVEPAPEDMVNAILPHAISAIAIWFRRPSDEALQNMAKPYPVYFIKVPAGLGKVEGGPTYDRKSLLWPPPPNREQVEKLIQNGDVSMSAWMKVLLNETN